MTDIPGPTSPKAATGETDAILADSVAADAEFSLDQIASLAAEQTSRLLALSQHEDGYWVGELEGDSILQSECILLLGYLGREQDALARRLGRQLLFTQRSSGGWSQIPEGPIDVSASVKAYFALKLIGEDPDSEPLTRARRAIREAGGADRVNSFTRFFLALLDQIDYRHCPAVPPEMVLLPTWFPFHLYRMSAWSRTIFVPLSIVWAHRPVRALPPERGIRELFLRSADRWPRLQNPAESTSRGRRWATWFRGVDRCLKFCEAAGIRPFRRSALRAAKDWMTTRLSDSDGLGAIFPPIVFSIIALDCLGGERDGDRLEAQFDHLLGLVIDDPAQEKARIQPCKSPVWDTALTTRALSCSGDQEHHSGEVTAAVERSCHWLLDREVRQPGDWSVGVDTESSGWFFEHRNRFYPDVDDTVMVLLALKETERLVDLPKAVGDRMPAAVDRGCRWIVAMQNRDGGWGAFDRDNDAAFLCHVPFADHNAMIDPSSPDLAGRAVEALVACGMRPGSPPLARAVRYLRQTQQEDGSWYGRWGVNYIYGTWQVLVGLAAAGVSLQDPAIRQGAQWLLAHQQPCGAWGESVDSYRNPQAKGIGEPTASQTAWAVLGLIASGHANHAATRAGIRWLVDTQQTDGNWDETQFTGTGFPLVFYLRYHMYPTYFPLLALAAWLERD